MTPGRAGLGAVALLGLWFVPAHAETIHVTIENLEFTPTELTAKVGDVVVWDNKDFLAHTATATNNDWNVVISPKQAGKVELKKAGTFDYFCRFHPNMKARLVVTQ
jgi:plastocyanin